MRIAFVTLGYAPLRMSGLDISGERLVGQLLREGHQVDVFAGMRTPQAETHQHPRLAIHRLRLGPSNWIGFAYQAARLIRKLNQADPFDVVHFWDIHFAYAYGGPYVASLQHSFRQRWSARDRRQAGGLVLAYRWMYYATARLLAEQSALVRAAGLLASSLAARDEYTRHYEQKPERIALARHGIDTQFFHRRQDQDQLRKHFGLSRDEPLILFVGFVTPRKGLEYLAQALPLIRPQPRLLLVGRWSEAARTRFLHRLGPWAGRVTEAGFVPDEVMPAIYSLASVYVSSSLLEGFGLPLAEALACQTPVVAARGGAVAEVVGPGGILVTPAEPVELAESISQLLTDEAYARELGRRGRQHIVEQFGLDRMCADTLQAYQRFLLDRPV